MSAPQNEFHEALRILNRYYAELSKQIADDVVEHKEEFGSGAYTQAEALIEKYARQIQQLGAVYGLLRWKAHREKPEGKVPLGKYDFRCFGCGGVIGSTEDACQICGWTWR
jgi:hypothetical protein